MIHLIDKTTTFIVDPLNVEFSRKHYLTASIAVIALTVFSGFQMALATITLSVLFSLVWKHFRPSEEQNETVAKIHSLSSSIFRRKQITAPDSSGFQSNEVSRSSTNQTPTTSTSLHPTPSTSDHSMDLAYSKLKAYFLHPNAKARLYSEDDFLAARYEVQSSSLLIEAAEIGKWILVLTIQLDSENRAVILPNKEISIFQKEEYPQLVESFVRSALKEIPNISETKVRPSLPQNISLRSKEEVKNIEFVTISSENALLLSPDTYEFFKILFQQQGIKEISSLDGLFTARFEAENPTILIRDKQDGDVLKIDSTNQIQIVREKKSFSSTQISSLIQSFIKNAIVLTSTYSKFRFEITILRFGLKFYPEYHLEQLVQVLLTKSQFISLLVHYSDSQHFEKTVIDAGGIARDYMDELFKNILGKLSTLFKALPSGLHLPQITTNGKTSSEHAQLYFNCGFLMMYCYTSNLQTGDDRKKYTIGRHFDSSIFAALLSLDTAEINTAYVSLSQKTLLKISLAFIKARMDAGDNLSYLFKVISFLIKPTIESISEIEQIMIDAEFLPDDYIPKKWTDFQSKDGSSFLNKAFDFVLFYDKPLHGSLSTLLPPLHAIAQGMKKSIDLLNPKSINYWDNSIKTVKPELLNAAIQGTIDRKAIVKAFKYRSDYIASISELTKKVDWLKEWILDKEKGATEQELQDLLKYLTGSSTLSPGKNIDIVCQSEKDSLPFLVIHTCSYLIEVSPNPSQYMDYNDHTKENFIRSLKNSIKFNKDIFSNQ